MKKVLTPKRPKRPTRNRHVHVIEGPIELLLNHDQPVTNRLDRIEALLVKLRKEGHEFMATVKETLAAINIKTDEMAADIVDVKAIVQKLKDGQTDPALEALAQEALDKLTPVAADLDGMGKSDPTIP